MMDERGLKIAQPTILRWDFNHAWATITGVEVMHMLRKGQARFLMNAEPQVLRNFIHRVFDCPGPIFPSYHNREFVF